MNLKKLLEYLTEHARGFSYEKRIRSDDGRQVYHLQVPLPEFPFGPDRFRWYTLIVESEEDLVPRSEIDGLLRHFWHFELDPFGEDKQ